MANKKKNLSVDKGATNKGFGIIPEKQINELDKAFDGAGFGITGTNRSNVQAYRILIYGSSSLSELIHIQRFMPNIPIFEISFVGFHTDSDKKRIRKYCEGSKFVLKFLPLSKLRQLNNYFDAILSFSCLFRQSSPNVYNKKNEHLLRKGIWNYAGESDKRIGSSF